MKMMEKGVKGHRSLCRKKSDSHGGKGGGKGGGREGGRDGGRDTDPAGAPKMAKAPNGCTETPTERHSKSTRSRGVPFGGRGVPFCG